MKRSERHNVMNDQQTALYERLRWFSLDDPNSQLKFSHRLARENGWSMEYAERVLAEYRRFIYLVAAGNEELTPSDQVDQAWHLHMTYSHSYWHELCRGVLGKELHHLPTKGGEREQTRFRDQYAKTLQIYEGEFGVRPPGDVWPPVEDRFENVEDFVRVNRARSWVIKKPNPLVTKGLAVMLVALTLVACTDDPEGYDIWFWLKVALGVFVLYKIFSWLDSGGRGGGSGGGTGCGGCSGCGGG